jgi:hypothetical protein
MRGSIDKKIIIDYLDAAIQNINNNKAVTAKTQVEIARTLLKANEVKG